MLHLVSADLKAMTLTTSFSTPSLSSHTSFTVTQRACLCQLAFMPFITAFISHVLPLFLCLPVKALPVHRSVSVFSTDSTRKLGVLAALTESICCVVSVEVGTVCALQLQNIPIRHIICNANLCIILDYYFAVKVAFFCSPLNSLALIILNCMGL